jgi:hypothetical protein
MRRFDVSKVVLTILFPCFTVAIASAVTPDPKLLSLFLPRHKRLPG